MFICNLNVVILGDCGSMNKKKLIASSACHIDHIIVDLSDTTPDYNLKSSFLIHSRNIYNLGSYENHSIINNLKKLSLSNLSFLEFYVSKYPYISNLISLMLHRTDELTLTGPFTPHLTFQALLSQKSISTLNLIGPYDNFNLSDFKSNLSSIESISLKGPFRELKIPRGLTIFSDVVRSINKKPKIYFERVHQRLLFFIETLFNQKTSIIRIQNLDFDFRDFVNDFFTYITPISSQESTKNNRFIDIIFTHKEYAFYEKNLKINSIYVPPELLRSKINNPSFNGIQMFEYYLSQNYQYPVSFRYV